MKSQVIELKTPLPCAVIDPDSATGICGKPATVAQATTGAMPGLTEPGEWLVTPMCRDCTLATVAMYEMDQGPASAKDRQPVPLISRKE